MTPVFRLLCGLLLLPAVALAGKHEKPAPVAADHDQLVILVRHAEKALDQGSDPALTARGEARAQSLAALLKPAGVGAIITTEWQRTRATAAPLAAALGVTPVVVSTSSADKGGADAHPRAVADAVRAQSADIVLVVGHSNTLPAIIAALGGPAIADLGDDEYGNFYTLWRHQGKATLVQSRY